jgi:hypothetical protein
LKGCPIFRFVIQIGAAFGIPAAHPVRAFNPRTSAAGGRNAWLPFDYVIVNCKGAAIHFVQGLLVAKDAPQYHCGMGQGRNFTVFPLTILVLRLPTAIARLCIFYLNLKCFNT